MSSYYNSLIKKEYYVLVRKSPLPCGWSYIFGRINDIPEKATKVIKYTFKKYIVRVQA